MRPDVLVGVDLPGDDAFAETPAGTDQNLVIPTGQWIPRKEDAGDVALGHLLDDHGNCRRRGARGGVAAVGHSPVVERRCPASAHGVDHVLGVEIKVRVESACERMGVAVLADHGTAHGERAAAGEPVGERRCEFAVDRCGKDLRTNVCGRSAEVDPGDVVLEFLGGYDDPPRHTHTSAS